MIVQSPSTAQELAQFISEAVRDHFERTGRRMSGAALADAVRGRYPDLEYERLGLVRLADAVKLAEDAGTLVRHRDVQHLEVSPSAETPRSPRPNQSTFVRIRPEVWRAFVFVTDPSAHFYDRETRVLLTVAPTDDDRLTQLSASDRYARVTPIPGEQQKQWMWQFLNGRNALRDLNPPVDVQVWWIAFPQWLREHADADPSAPRAWSAFRAARVAEHITAWASDNGIPADVLFQASVAAEPRRRTFESDERSNRRAILAAIAETAYDDLMELRLPLKYVLRHFKAR